ncbi:hypothetical protein Aau02nite_24250 [Amorphoplanes auranticolor]|uniref:DNA ligase D polymerase domain-containing protein n=1 Tax=Actinoplanes auranticolor TaxID=47988 RepID=A0A919VKM3_9ACTN|nr:hypothetical protein Aau02nite_24250 [Actinoplanes auranticolor]
MVVAEPEREVAEERPRQPVPLDYPQNAINRTLVAPYSPRPAPGAPVSAPITWDELDDPGLRPDGFTIRSVLPRLETHGDLFSAVLDHRQALPPLR